MKIHNYDNMGSLDKKSLELVWKAYNDTRLNEDIFEIGFNLSSGYVYIALENNISIASCFGQSVDFIVTDYENGDEFYFDTYNEAYNKLEKLNEKV
jgi:hypothetical protein